MQLGSNQRSTITWGKLEKKQRLESLRIMSRPSLTLVRVESQRRSDEPTDIAWTTRTICQIPNLSRKFYSECCWEHINVELDECFTELFLSSGHSSKNWAARDYVNRWYFPIFETSGYRKRLNSHRVPYRWDSDRYSLSIPFQWRPVLEQKLEYNQSPQKSAMISIVLLVISRDMRGSQVLLALEG